MQNYLRKATESLGSLKNKVKQGFRVLAPGHTAWKGAALGVALLAALSWIALAYAAFASAGLLSFILAIIGGFVLAIIVGGLLTLIHSLHRKLPLYYFWALSGAILLLALTYMTTSLIYGTIAIILLIVLSGSLIGGGAASLFRGRSQKSISQKRLAITAVAVGMLFLGGSLLWSSLVGAPTPPINAANLSADNVAVIDLPDPSLPGSYQVKTLTYGSGTDLRRPEYGEEAIIKTDPVDGSMMIEGWSALRTSYWGFGPDELPLNGRAWYPEGEGPFPLILIVHGNHLMEDFSDPGYAYLGKLLASRGFITVSVDQNFLNFSMSANITFLNALKKENDLRAWLLLEHLRLWQKWSKTAGHTFSNKVDFDSIGLVGHSRGGEAVAIATAFSKLSSHPDNAQLRLNYDFDIHAIAAIAPVDGQYMPGDMRLPLDNISYLVLHGSHDMDVVSFQGMRQYSRINFTDQVPHFKTALYVYGANHGQFNSRWGNRDLFGPALALFNLAAIMPAEDQEKIAAVTLSAFFEAVLHEKNDYKMLFRDPRTAGNWLPDTVYISQYLDSDTVMLCNYAEDIDPRTTTIPGGVIEGKNLSLWREGDVPLKWGTLENRALYIGWNSDSDSSPAVYSIYLPQSEVRLNSGSTLVFSMAENEQAKAGNLSKDHIRELPAELIDFTIELTDSDGNSASLPLSHFSLLQPRLESRLAKAGFMQSLPRAEAVFQNFEFQLADFTEQNQRLNPEKLQTISFVFNLTPSGSVIINDIGLRLTS